MRAALERRVGGEPAGGVPLLEDVADLRLGELYGQEALGGDGVAGFLVRDDGGRAAEGAALGDFAGLEDGDGPAAFTADLDGLGAEAAAFVAYGCEGLLEGVFVDLSARRLVVDGLDFGDEAAERAGEDLLSRVPLHFPAALRAGAFTESRDFRHRRSLTARGTRLLKIC